MNRAFWVAAVALAFLSACGPDENTVTVVLTGGQRDPKTGMAVWDDQTTGCQYFETYKGGITPRLNTDGKPFCTGEYYVIAKPDGAVQGGAP